MCCYQSERTSVKQHSACRDPASMHPHVIHYPKILPAVLTPSLRYQSSVLPPSIRDLKQHHNRKSHPHDRSTNSRIHLSNPALGAREMARNWLNTRITWERSKSAASGSIRRACAFAAVAVTGGRVISRDRSRREAVSGYPRGCSRCGCRSSCGFG